MDSQSQSWDSGGPHQFPAGLRVLVVDDDATCLKIIDRMLKKCQYTVTTCSRAVVALEILRENKEGFDIVLSDVHMPDMDGFKLLVHIGLEMDLPVIMMSADDGKDVVMKGVKHGACDYLIKPVSMKALKNIWQHVFRKMRNELKDLDNSGSLDDSDKQKKPLDEGDSASSGSWKATKRKKAGEEDDELEEREDSSTLKKSRVVWSVDLHQQFVAAVNHLGLEKAVPKKILELMNDPALTRENVASHLQKYRLYLKRLSVAQHQGRADASFSNPPDTSINQVSSFDLQALAASGQTTPQSFMYLHPVSRRVANISMVMPALDQRGFFNSDTGPTMVQKLNNNQMPLHSIPRLAANVSMGMPNCDHNSNAQLANSSNARPPMMRQMNNNQMSVFYESSTSMGPRHIGQEQVFQVSNGIQEFMNPPSSLRANSTFPGGSFGQSTNPFVTQMIQQGHQISLAQQGHMQSGVQLPPQSSCQLLNGISTGKQIVSNGITNHILVRNGTEVNGRASLQGNYTTMSQCGTVPQSLSSNFQNSNMSKSNCHSHVNSMLVVPGGLATLDNVAGLTRDVFSDFDQSKNEGWNLQDRNHSYESKQSNTDYDFSLKAHQDANAILVDRTLINSCTVGKEISPGGEIKHETVECISPDLLFSDDNFPNELMSVIKR